MNTMTRPFMYFVLSAFMCLGLLALPAAYAQKITDEKKEVCGMCGEVRFIQRVVTRHSSAPSARTPSAGRTGGGLLGRSPAGGIASGGPSLSTPDGGRNEYTDRIFIDMDVGGSKIVELPSPSGVRRGDRVKVTGNIVQIIEDDF